MKLGKFKNKNLFILLAILILTSCSSVSKLRTYSVEVDESVNENKMCKVIIFNDSHKVLYSQGTGIIDIRLDNSYYGKILIKDFIEFETNIGDRTLVLEHWDVGYFSSKHSISLKEGNNYIKLKAKPTSHRIEILDSLSNSFYQVYNKRPIDKDYIFTSE